jgi:hypothetical protein
MPTLLKLGPADHGRPLTLDEHLHSSYQEGYYYGLIRGKLDVLSRPEFPRDYLAIWIRNSLFGYQLKHSEVIDYISQKSSVFVPGDEEPSCLRPEIAAYQGLNPRLPSRGRRWQDVSPLLVADVLWKDNADRDPLRNLDLYLQVPSIREYWIVDGREDADRPALLVYRRRGQRWQNVIRVGPGEVYTTRLLPGFSLTLDPHS